MTFSILSWNILAQRYTKNTSLVWKNRLEVILSLLSRTDTNIILLQEVELETFEADFEPLFEKYNYTRHVQNKKRNNPIGNAILWKKDWAVCSNNYSKTRSLHVKLDILEEKQQIFVSNVHLSAGLGSKSKERSKELSSCLSLYEEEDNIILGGDFNDDFSSDDGIVTLLEDKFSSPVTAVTCAVGERGFNFDHILVSGKLNIKRTPLFIDMFNVKLPSITIPSDHIPIVSIIKRISKEN